MLSSDGQHNLALLINEGFVFRFPRFAGGVTVLRHEAEILHFLQGKVTLPIPDPLYSALDSDFVGQVFLGYPLLPGEPVTRAVLPQLQQSSAGARLAKQMGEFLRTLHAVPVDAVQDKWPVQDTVANWEQMLEMFRTHLFSHMRPDARDLVEANFASGLRRLTERNNSPVLRHGDFGAGNILWDAEEGILTGIIDFGFAGLGDAAVDIAATMSLGESLFAAIWQVYQGPDSLLEQAQFYQSTFALQEALYGVIHEDPEAFEAGIASYR